MGLLMQPLIGRLYENRTGFALDDMDGVTMISDSNPFMAAHFDFRVSGKKRHLVECKNFHSMRRKEFGEEGSDDIPMDCLVQCLHEGHVAGADVVDLAVLFGGQKFEIFTVPIRNDAVDMLVDKLRTFWNHVETREPPAPQTNDEAKALWKKDNGGRVVATREIEKVCSALERVKADIKAATEFKERFEVEIKNAIGNASAIVSADQSIILATWMNAKSSLSFNKKQFALEQPQMYERYCSMVPGSRRLLLKRRGIIG